MSRHLAGISSPTRSTLALCRSRLEWTVGTIPRTSAVAGSGSPALRRIASTTSRVVRGSGEARSTSAMALNPAPFLKGDMVLFFRRGAIFDTSKAGSSILITRSTQSMSARSRAASRSLSRSLPPSSAWSRSRAYRAGLCFMRRMWRENDPASRCHIRHLRHNTVMKAIITKYHGPTNFKGSRISASDMDGNRATISYPHELSGEACHFAAAQALCKKMGWGGKMAGGALKNGYAFVFLA